MQREEYLYTAPRRASGGLTRLFTGLGPSAILGLQDPSSVHRKGAAQEMSMCGRLAMSMRRHGAASDDRDPHGVTDLHSRDLMCWKHVQKMTRQERKSLGFG
jgi:hypothetical protein